MKLEEAILKIKTIWNGNTFPFKLENNLMLSDAYKMFATIDGIINQSTLTDSNEIIVYYYEPIIRGEFKSFIISKLAIEK